MIYFSTTEFGTVVYFITSIQKYGLFSQKTLYSQRVCAVIRVEIWWLKCMPLWSGILDAFL